MTRLILPAVALFLAPCLVRAADAKPESVPVPWVEEAKGIRVASGIPYATAGGQTLKLDLAIPEGKGPFPVVVCLHGGAWRLGSRADVGPFIRLLAQNGYAAAAVSYRLAPKHQFPAPIEDAKTAVRYLRANAAKYDLEPTQVAALGFSAGGHLALLLGLTDKAAGFDGPLYPDQSSKVQCVIDFFGPSDMSLYKGSEGIMDAYIVPFLGAKCKDDPAVLQRASPIDYVSKAAPPTLIIHGNADVIVPIIHSERIYEKLKAAGAPVEMMVVKGGGHGFFDDDIRRNTALATQKFLNAHLKGQK